MEREDFIIVEAQFRLAAAARVVLSKLPPQTVKIISADYPEDIKEKKLVELRMLRDCVSLPLYRLALGLREIIFALRSLITANYGEAIELYFEGVRGTKLNGGEQIPKGYLISRVCDYALFDEATGNQFWEEVWKCLKDQEISLGGFKVVSTPQGSLIVELSD